MALVSGIITINSKNEFSTFKRMQVSDITDLLKLPKQLQYEIGIDQSTSCTGIYIQDTKNLVNILLELEYANKDKKDYFADIFYLFLKENKITTIQRCNPNTIYYSTSNDFRIVTDGVVKENIINFSKVMGIHNKQDFEISHCVSKASFVILSTKHKTILYTEESVDKVQALLKKYKEKLKITNTVVELHKK